MALQARDGGRATAAAPLTMLRLVCASANPDKVAEIAGDPRRGRHGRAAAPARRRGRRRRGRRHARGQRAAEGSAPCAGRPASPRSPTTRVSRSTRSTAVRASRRRTSRGRRRRTPRTGRSCSRRSDGVPPTRRLPGSGPSRWSCGPMAGRSSRRACATGSIAESERGGHGLGLRPAVHPGRRLAHVQRDDRRGEERRRPPRPRLPRPAGQAPRSRVRV